MPLQSCGTEEDRWERTTTAATAPPVPLYTDTLGGHNPPTRPSHLLRGRWGWDGCSRCCMLLYEPPPSTLPTTAAIVRRQRGGWAPPPATRPAALRGGGLLLVPPALALGATRSRPLTPPSPARCAQRGAEQNFLAPHSPQPPPPPDTNARRRHACPADATAKAAPAGCRRKRGVVVVVVAVVRAARAADTLPPPTATPPWWVAVGSQAGSAAVAPSPLAPREGRSGRDDGYVGGHGWGGASLIPHPRLATAGLSPPPPPPSPRSRHSRLIIPRPLPLLALSHGVVAQSAAVAHPTPTTRPGSRLILSATLAHPTPPPAPTPFFPSMVEREVGCFRKARWLTGAQLHCRHSRVAHSGGGAWPAAGRSCKILSVARRQSPPRELGRMDTRGVCAWGPNGSGKGSAAAQGPRACGSAGVVVAGGGGGRGWQEGESQL